MAHSILLKFRYGKVICFVGLVLTVDQHVIVPSVSIPKVIQHDDNFMTGTAEYLKIMVLFICAHFFRLFLLHIIP